MTKKNNTEKPKLKDALSSAIFFKMREDILDGDLKAGDKLKIASLKDRYNSGHSPIREALSRLLPEGLVEREDQKGYRVHALDPADLIEITKMRCWLEEIAIRESIRLGDANWEESVVLAHHRLMKEERYLDDEKQEPNRTWEELHESFHTALVTACDSKWLTIYGQNLQRLTERYRRNDLKINYYKRNAKEEHTRIFEAAINRDANLAAKLLVNHHQTTSDMILETLKKEST